MTDGAPRAPRAHAGRPARRISSCSPALSTFPVESARSAAYCAAWCAAERSAELPAVASLAKAYCSDAYVLAAGENIQVHGGIGFTWEHAAHLYFRRAKSSDLLFGDAGYHRELLARRIGV